MDATLSVSNGLLVVLVLLNFAVLGSSRMSTLIRMVAIQGLLLGTLPQLRSDVLSWHLIAVGAMTAAIKAALIPLLLRRAMRDVRIRREVEPLLGFIPSLLMGALGTGMAVVFSNTLPWPAAAGGALVLSTSISMLLTGFIILTTRRKAITQVVGYLILENGIFTFGLLLLDAVPFLVEVGVLLDLFVAVFVMVIILNHIQATFLSHDTTRLSLLKE
ncbi:MAG: hydrogenase [Candidatus Lambdaproteobacteria bacterium]|nr:hydrogenase [Candidatus Lambdaproteobacteria bacterium]